jgi:hypothetical protein
MFRRKELTLNRVRDHITIREGDDTLNLTVDSNANMLIRGVRTAQKTLQRLQEENNEELKETAAKQLSEAIFGKEQAGQLLDFYNGNFECVITICGMYFGDPKNGLGKKITKAQKKSR